MSHLIVDRVSVAYPGSAPGEAALHDVSLSIGPGELVVALGPSGCGKTTLLNLIAGFLQPTRGQILLDGRAVRGPSAERGVVFQDDTLLPWQSVIENVGFGLQLSGQPRIEREAVAQKILQWVDLAGFEHHRVWQLSGGMKQRVGLARGLAADPRILLLDEPFAALDAFTREQMQELLLRVWQRSGKQIFLITHDLEEAVFLSTELVLLSPRPGRIVERIPLEFGKRYAAGEPARRIKADPEFIATREYLRERVFNQREAVLQ
ncbi:taurine ABC transporter ATP-binding subunit [Niveibacterium sp.]|uniref:taurine ABC transporter ATP-binding subunit n=1 Tax=Niveibacterium sp. TaxID=2017444 RepID=UPI0035B0429E